MDTSTSEPQSLLARVERLERQYHWFKSEVVTEKLVLVDADGKTRATLRMSEGVPSLILYDPDENVRAVLRVSAEGAALHLLDSKTKAGLELTVGEAGPEVSLLDVSGKQRLTLEVLRSESGTPCLAMRNTNGVASVVVTALDAGPSIALSDPSNADGNTSVRIQVNSEVSPGHYEEPEGPSLLCVKRGKILWSAP